MRTRFDPLLDRYTPSFRLGDSAAEIQRKDPRFRELSYSVYRDTLPSSVEGFFARDVIFDSTQALKEHQRPDPEARVEEIDLVAGSVGVLEAAEIQVSTVLGTPPREVCRTYGNGERWRIRYWLPDSVGLVVSETPLHLIHTRDDDYFGRPHLSFRRRRELGMSGLGACEA